MEKARKELLASVPPAAHQEALKKRRTETGSTTVQATGGPKGELPRKGQEAAADADGKLKVLQKNEPTTAEESKVKIHRERIQQAAIEAAEKELAALAAGGVGPGAGGSGLKPGEKQSG